MTAPGLATRLAELIRMEGPMTVAAFVTACLHDPRDGYYATRPSLGAEGDFVTAPLVSQMFGELIGVWLSEMWRQLGSPDQFHLVELGPGDGSLMHDVLRVIGRVPGMAGASELWLVEPSAPLRRLQQQRLADAAPRFADALAQVPCGAPMLAIANEVFDCLPARQFVRTPAGWAERRIGLDDAGALTFGLGPLPAGLERGLPDGPPGTVVERSPAQAGLAAEIAARVVVDGGGALAIDYGRDRPGFGDTLQAVSRHGKVDPLHSPGAADLTQHVDFPALASAAVEAGAAVSPIVTQRAFLRALGVEARAQALSLSRPDRADTIGRQLDRLIGGEQMGDLFKAMSIHAPGLEPPGFACRPEIERQETP